MPNAPKKITRSAATKRVQKARESLSFRLDPEIRPVLEREAKKAGHSLSAEINKRLLQAYSEREWARASLAEAFGDYETQGILFLLAQAAASVSDRRRAHWLDDEESWRQTVAAFLAILYRVAPTERARWQPSRPEWVEYTGSEEYQDAGRLVATKLLASIEEAPDSWWPFGNPCSLGARELQQDIIDRKQLLNVLRDLLDSRKGKAIPAGRNPLEDV